MVTESSAARYVSQRPPLKPGTSMAAWGDAAFRWITLAFGLVTVLLIAWIGIGLFRQSSLTRHMFGWHMLASRDWDEVHVKYGALPYIFGTCVTAGLAMLFAVPLGVGAALFLTEMAPHRLAALLAFFIEMLAAVPSVIYGLWGFLVLCPWLNTHLYPWLADHFGTLPIFAGPATLTNFLAAGLVLAVMVLPFITAVSREVIRTVPAAQREASLALGANKWETVRSVVLKGASKGIAGACILALGRAVGETMAVAMVIGSNPQITASILKSGYTMPALLANQFNEAFSDDVQRSALLEIALILFVITLFMNAAARLLIIFMSKGLTSNPAASASKRAVNERAAAAVSIGLKAMVTCAVAALVVVEIVRDVRVHGLRALHGPLPAVVALYITARLITWATRGTRGWSIWRKANSFVMHAILALCALIAVSALGLVVSYVVMRGTHGLHVQFFTHLPGAPDDPTSGMKNGIYGTAVLVGIAASIGIPAGLLGGVFLAEFGKTRMGGLVRFSADVLNGIPSVVIGMFAYAAFVLPVGHFSAWAGGAALGIMMLPTIMRTTEEMINMVPGSLREASLGIGATRVCTIRSIILPAARAGIVTGIMLAIARIAGETAPLLFTAFGNDLISTKLSEPVSSITMMIYKYAGSAFEVWIQLAWTGALVLLMLVLVISIMARAATRNKYALR